MVAIRETTGPARNSLISAGVSLAFLPIHSGVCLSVISSSLSLRRCRLTDRQLFLYGTKTRHHHRPKIALSACRGLQSLERAFTVARLIAPADKLTECNID